MSIVSEICADLSNKILKQKAEVLATAILCEDWEKVKEILAWMQSEPFNE